MKMKYRLYVLSLSPFQNHVVVSPDGFTLNGQRIITTEIAQFRDGDTAASFGKNYAVRYNANVLCVALDTGAVSVFSSAA